MNTYLFRVRGQVDVDELNAMSPHQMLVMSSDPGSTLFTICTDQAGMLGLMRHLHNLGIELLSMGYQPESPPAASKD